MQENLHITVVKNYRHWKGQHVRTETHRTIELVFHLYGIGFENIGGKNFHFNSNSLSVVLPGTPHDKLYAEQSEVVSIHFTTDLPFFNESAVYYIKDENIRELFMRMREEIASSRPHRMQMLTHLLGEALVLFSRTEPLYYPTGDIESAAFYIDTHYAKKIDFKKLATDSNYSYDRFRHIFKEKMGKAPRDYMIARRLSRAKYLLETTSLSIAAIAEQCGFATNAQFSAIFKNNFSTTPATYRKNLKKR